MTSVKNAHCYYKSISIVPLCTFVNLRIASITFVPVDCKISANLKACAAKERPYSLREKRIASRTMVNVNISRLNTDDKIVVISVRPVVWGGRSKAALWPQPPFCSRRVI